MIYRNRDGSYDYTEPTRGERGKSRVNLAALAKDQTLAGLYHTHGDHGFWDIIFRVQDWTFSPADKELADDRKIPSYLGTPRGNILEYDPALKRVTALPR